jgi:hypothetical protein
MQQRPPRQRLSSNADHGRFYAYAELTLRCGASLWAVRGGAGQWAR